MFQNVFFKINFAPFHLLSVGCLGHQHQDRLQCPSVPQRRAKIWIWWQRRCSFCVQLCPSVSQCKRTISSLHNTNFILGPTTTKTLRDLTCGANFSGPVPRPLDGVAKFEHLTLEKGEESLAVPKRPLVKQSKELCTTWLRRKLHSLLLRT